MEDATGVKVITAKVPLSEMFGYVGDLRSKTSGRAVYSMSFDSYSEVRARLPTKSSRRTRANDAYGVIRRVELRSMSGVPLGLLHGPTALPSKNN